MISRKWLLVGGQCAIALIISIVSFDSRAQANLSAEDYLEWPKVDYTQHDDYHAKVRLALEKLARAAGSLARDDTGNWFGQAVEQFARASREGEKFSPDERSVFARIHSLSWEENVCGLQELDLYRSLSIQLRDRKLPAELRRVIEETCRMFIWRCSLKRNSSRWSIDAEVEKQLDTVWAAAFDENYRGDIHNGLGYKLATALKEFDLATSEFNAKKMLKLVRRFESERGATREPLPEPLGLLRNFMLRRCDKFGLDLKITVDLLDLIRKAGFGPVSWTNPDLDRMDEYQRLCLALRRPEREEVIRANLIRQLMPRAVGDKLASRVQEWVWRS